MIGTLIKHEALRTRGFVLTIAGAGAGLAVVGSLMALTGWPVLSQFGVVLGFIGAFGMLPALQLALGVDYWRSSYGRIGYFTQTLPVRGSRIYRAKLVWALLVMLAGLLATVGLWLVVMLGAAPTMLGLTPGEFLEQAGEILASAFEAAPWLVALGAPALLVLLYSLSTVMYACAASIGSERWLQRLGWGGPVVVWFGLYTVLQIAMFVAILAIPFGLGVDDAGRFGVIPADLLGALVTDTDLQLMPIGFVPVLVVAIIAMVWATVRSWDHRVSLA
jgi:hypothetical protein